MHIILRLIKKQKVLAKIIKWLYINIVYLLLMM